MKRKILAGSELRLTNEVADYPDWTKDAIEERQSRLAELAVETWPRE